MSVDVSTLVHEDWVDSRIYTDPSLLREEIERIWFTRWLYVGHESEVPEPGDYVARTVGTVPLVVTRGKDRSISVLLNRCPHRGNTVCTRSEGNSSYLRCAYHGWTFNLDGSTARVPLPDAYPDTDGPQFSMTSVPNVDTFRGLIFVSFSPQLDDVATHLGPARSRIERSFDRSPTGRVAIGGVQRCEIRANWKLVYESATDHYHPSHVHQSAVRVDTRLRDDVRATEGAGAIGVVRDLGRGMAELDFGDQHREVGAGFVRPPADDILEKYRQTLADAHGPERAAEVLRRSVPHVQIFPNLFLVQNDLRVTEPVTPTMTRYYNYYFDLEGVDPEINWWRRRRQELAYGPAGVILQDDLEVWERNQVGMAAALGGPEQRVDLTRGIHRETVEHDGTRVSLRSSDETGIRSFWREYSAVMTGER